MACRNYISPFIFGGLVSEMKESEFQKGLINEIKKRYRGCLVMKNDPNYIQGIPDLIVLYKNRWAALECKKNDSSGKQPNQKYYVEKMGSMSFASFIFPENRDDVLNRLDKFFE